MTFDPHRVANEAGELESELRELVEQWREDAENMRTELGEDPNEDQFKWGYQSAIVNKANELEEVLDG